MGWPSCFGASAADLAMIQTPWLKGTRIVVAISSGSQESLRARDLIGISRSTAPIQLYGFDAHDTSFRALNFDAYLDDFILVPNSTLGAAIIRPNGNGQAAYLVQFGYPPAGPRDVAIPSAAFNEAQLRAISDILKRKGNLGGIVTAASLNPGNGRVVGADDSRVRRWVQFDARSRDMLYW